MAILLKQIPGMQRIFHPKFQSAAKKIPIAYFSIRFVVLFIYRYMYRNVHLLPPGRAILYFLPLKPCHCIHDFQNRKCRTYLHIMQYRSEYMVCIIIIFCLIK